MLKENVKALRRRKKMTQRDLALASGLATNHIGHLETGRIVNPRGDVLIRLARALDVSVEKLAGAPRA